MNAKPYTLTAMLKTVTNTDPRFKATINLLSAPTYTGCVNPEFIKWLVAKYTAARGLGLLGPAKLVFARRHRGHPSTKQTVMQQETIDFRYQAWVNIRIGLSMPLRLVSKVDGRQWRNYSAGKSYLGAGYESPLWINLLRKASSFSFGRAERSLSGIFSSRFLSTCQPKGKTKAPNREWVHSPLILESGVDKITALISALSGSARAIVTEKHSKRKEVMQVDRLSQLVKAAALSQSDQGRRRTLVKSDDRSIGEKWPMIQKEGVASVVETVMPGRPSLKEVIFPAASTRTFIAPHKQRQISGVEHRSTPAAVENGSSTDHSLAGSNPLSLPDATRHFSNSGRRIKPPPMQTQEFRTVHPIVEAVEKHQNRNFTAHTLRQPLNTNLTKPANYGFFESPAEGRGHFDLTTPVFKLQSANPQSAWLSISNALPISGRGIARTETNQLSPPPDIYPAILHSRSYRHINESPPVSELPTPVYADHPRLVYSVNQTAGSPQSRVHPSEVQQARPPKKITTQVTKAAGDIPTKVEHAVSGDRTAQSPAVDINELAGKVYDRIERKIQTEKERRGL